MKVIASSVRKGNILELDGQLYSVLSSESFFPGKGTPTTQVEMRRLSDGVKTVQNRIDTLPVSQFDDQLRYQIARSIYGNSNFWNYAIMPNPPIHIIVEHGRVTLTGVVQSHLDRMLARSLATNFLSFSVTNHLKTDAEVREAIEKS